VREILGVSEESYTPRQAAYDLKKLRGKGLVAKISGSRRYGAARDGLRSMVALRVLRDKVIAPLLAAAGKRKSGRKPADRGEVDAHYENIQIHMQKLFQSIGIAA
jgi:hypothetical protein